MKKLTIFLILISSLKIYSQIENEIINMFGISDSTGKSYLIYEDVKLVWNYFNGKKINAFDLNIRADSVIAEETGWWQHGDFGIEYIRDYDFYDTPNAIVYVKLQSYGLNQIINKPLSLDTILFSFFSPNILIDKNNPNKLFLTSEDPSGYAVSLDSGRTWPSYYDSHEGVFRIETIPFNLLSLYPNSDSIMFGIDSLGNLTKSYDSGLTREIVEESGNWNFLRENLYYDIDGIHIYAITQKENSFYLYVSDNFGNKDSWNLLFTSPQKISISVDNLISGKFTFSSQNNIYQSTDYGQTFNTIHTLDKNIVGVFNIPNSDTIYAATGFSILEIAGGNVVPIKQVISNELLSYYPLQLGNKWYYEIITDPVWVIGNYKYNLTKEVISDSTFDNGKKYFVLKETRDDTNTIKIYYERIDSLNGKVYKLDNAINNNIEFVYLDLYTSLGDSFQTFIDITNFYENESLILSEEKDKYVFKNDSKQSLTKTYVLNSIDNLEFFNISFAKNFGKSYQLKGYFDAYDEYQYLTAAFINGEKYGDTTIVGVDDISNDIPSNFSLSQNYPNPFNPSTTIEYRIPFNLETHGHASLQLIVYDVLGKEVATLVNQVQKPGNYKVNFNANQLSSGIYFYQLKYGSFVQTKKMILMK